MNKFLLPLLGFIVLVGFLAAGLKLDPKIIPSPLINKAAPIFSVPTLFAENETISTEKMLGKVWLMNVWASWCAACRVEHPLINALAEQNLIEIVGLNYKDERDKAKQWLKVFGNPYTTIAYDFPGDVGIDYGVYGVPESFLIDKHGQIRYKQIGPFTAQSIEEELLPLIHTLQAES
ncbi:MAG: DsbE family thiol:disulfide interchange protein [Arenicellales bacterium]